MLTSAGPWAIAHRGEPRSFPDNSIAGVLAAARLGADVVEVDVRTTSDGVAVLHHGRSLTLREGRGWRGGSLAELTFDQLRARAPGVATLAEALDAVAGLDVRLLLDVGSVDEARAAAATLAEGSAATPGGTSLWFCGAAGALAWLRAQDVPAPRLLSWDDRPADLDAVLDDVAPTMVNPRHRGLDRDAVRRWHDRGLGVCTWTVDRAARRRALLDWGVDAVISNDVRGAVRDVRARRPTPG